MDKLNDFILFTKDHKLFKKIFNTYSKSMESKDDNDSDIDIDTNISNVNEPQMIPRWTATNVNKFFLKN